ncbi:Esterase/lipase [Oceanospirillum multiglobuliferum]|uniref:Alpha/beta hydrolase n=1 Tax=Oceanospirillum multiglobuliferum TaxID=64969 RepID=A0A1T4SGA2_9GAMM|nr:alpha/beta fold hydrolase [Oceanospirillum multiglobuliferum]OPX54297.1 alpha/beta hydrolase [Oceanospirillum multiglobuliferum]SKA26831.1 Esterase/lipase [Oceanospirillum multiglobuliferum]
MRTTIFGLTLLFALMISACSHKPVTVAKALPAYQQTDFQHYIQDTQQWLWANRRFHTADHAHEVQINSPFELIPNKPNGKAALLIHGLSDSPFSFVDVAQHLVEQGFLVRTVLLSGHGSKAEDLMLPELADWRALVKHHTALLSQSHDQVWLGGYSTGANLATIEASENPKVSGLLLFSPAFEPQNPFVPLSPFLRHLMTWADQDQEDNIAKYESLPMQAVAVYQQSAQLARERLATQALTVPVFMAVAEADSVIDPDTALKLFETGFTHPYKQLIWFGEKPLESANIQVLSMRLPDQQISTGSHMSALYREDNPHYGRMGKQRICNNGQEAEQEQTCRSGAAVWYSAWGYQEAGKVHARLSWNPYFTDTMQRMEQVLEVAP